LESQPNRRKRQWDNKVALMQISSDKDWVNYFYFSSDWFTVEPCAVCDSGGSLLIFKVLVTFSVLSVDLQISVLEIARLNIGQNPSTTFKLVEFSRQPVRNKVMGWRNSVDCR
jgi:hypothetical protein